jgi:hypothetical protein
MAHPIPFHAENLIGDPMRTVIFKTENAVFQFDRKDVEVHLGILATEYGVDEADAILKRIAIPSDKPILIETEHDYFGRIALDLIDAGKGSVTCEVCGRSYKPNQLKLIKIGHGVNPFEVNMLKRGGIKSLFKKKRKQPAMFGGKGYECPAGHELISMITWRT